MTVTDPVIPARARLTRHESFLIYQRYRYLKIGCAVIAVSILLYLVDSPFGARYGGSWAGYILGTAGAFLILWLTWFGYRKRSYLKDQGNLVAWLSAHVYLGLSLLVIATLHTGFSFRLEYTHAVLGSDVLGDRERRVRRLLLCTLSPADD